MMTREEAREFTGQMVAYASMVGPTELAEIIRADEPLVLVRLQDRDVAVHRIHLTDPEMLPAQDKIRFAEALIRQEHRVLSPGYMFWGHVADHLNSVAHVPDKTGQRASDRRAFSNAQNIASGYIRLSAAARCPCGGTGKIVRLYPDSKPEPWRPGSYADGVVQPCPRGHGERS